MITTILDRLSARRRRRQTTLFLAGLSDYQLRDIGITRHDLVAPRSPR